MKIGVIVDGGQLQRFALDALNALEGADEISVYSCTNTHRRKRWVRHAAYYGLNLVSLRNRLTRMVPVRGTTKRIAEWVDFQSGYEGAWQVLPEPIIGAMAEAGLDVILKFGMGLMRVPPPETLPVPILSYHHGDPDHYRGRPAGFWEMMHGTPVMGQIVQVLSNQLDAGHVVAYAETKVHPWSYRATMVESFRHSPLLINTAVRNLLQGRVLEKSRKGRNWRLPSNVQAMGFVAKMSSAAVRRLGYGAAFEKKWQVATAPVAGERIDDLLAGKWFPAAPQWRNFPVGSGYSFYADPFFVESGRKILVEAASARSGIGEILLLSEAGDRPLLQEKGHLSYPAPIDVAGRTMIIPESARWSQPRVYELTAEGLRYSHLLTVEGCDRITDPTIIEQDGRFYLFGNCAELGSNVLHLWSSPDLREPFRRHPASPIRISPQGSRMAGSLFRHGGRLVRFGQDFSRAYGEGIIAFEVTDLSADSYAERPIGSIRLDGRKGPHTINFANGQILFDWYSDRFSPGAGARRVSVLLRNRAISRGRSGPPETNADAGEASDRVLAANGGGIAGQPPENQVEPPECAE